MQRNKHDIFISYSRKDLALVRQIKREIESSTNAHCWMDLNGSDGGVESGSSSFAQAIVDAIENCKMFLFMLSDNSQESFYALRELNYAYDEKDILGIHVVIININNCRITNKQFKLLYGLADIISWTDVPQHDKLINDLRSWVKTESEYMAKKRSEMTEKAKDYLYNKKDRKKWFLFSGQSLCESWEGDRSFYYCYTQEEIDHFVKLFIEIHDAECDDGIAKDLNDVVNYIPLHEYEGSKPEIDKLLERCRDDEMDLWDIDTTPRYLYSMSFFYWDPEAKEMSNRIKISVELSDEEYLYLLIEQLLDRNNFNYNRLLVNNPELAIKIGNRIENGYEYYGKTFLVIFDEVLDDVEAIYGPKDVGGILFQETKNDSWYTVYFDTHRRKIELTEEWELKNNGDLDIHKRYLRNINADEVMKRLEAVDYPDMLNKLKERYNTSTALADIKSWLDAESIAYKEA